MSDPQIKRIKELRRELEGEQKKEEEESLRKAQSEMKGIEMVKKRHKEYQSDKQKFSELERKNRETARNLSQQKKIEGLEKYKYVAIDKILEYIRNRNYRFKDCIDNNRDEEGYDDIEKCLRELKSLISNEQKTSDNEFLNVSIEIIYDIYNSNNIENVKELVNTWREKQSQLLGGKRKKKSRKTKQSGKRSGKRSGKQSGKKKVKKVVRKKKSKKKKR